MSLPFARHVRLLRTQPLVLGQLRKLGVHEHVFGGTDRICSRPDVWCFEFERKPPAPADLCMRSRSRVIRWERVVLRERDGLRLNATENAVDHVRNRCLDPTWSLGNPAETMRGCADGIQQNNDEN